MTTSIKTCFKCEISKPLGEYYRHKEMFDGHLNKCKECTKADVRQHRRSDEHREKVLAYDRNRGCRQTKAYRDNHRMQRPEEYKARTMVSNALRSGKLEKPDRCQNCGDKSPLHGHHPDYSKPLSVVWLCVPCHRQIHAFNNLEKKAVSGGNSEVLT